MGACLHAFNTFGYLALINAAMFPEVMMPDLLLQGHLCKRYDLPGACLGAHDSGVGTQDQS